MQSIDSYTKTLLFKKDWQNPESLEDLGYIYYGPLVFNFFAWLRYAVIGEDKILFNSREGYFLKEIYDIFQSKFDLPLGVYFKTSRKLSTIVSLFNKSDVYRTFELHRYSGTLKDLLRDRFGVDIDVVENIEIDTQIEIPNLDLYIDYILNKASKTRIEYKKYIDKTIGDSRQIVMVDSGFQGTTQWNIERTYNLYIKGRYMTYKGNLPLKDAVSFYNFDRCKFKNNIIFFESVFIDKVGSYIDIENGEFINEIDSINQLYFNDKNKIVNGIKKFVNDMLDTNIDLTTSQQIFADEMFDLMCNTDFVKNEKLFSTFYHDNSYTRNNTKKIHRK